MSKVISIVSAVVLGVVVMALPLLTVLTVSYDRQTQVSPMGRQGLESDFGEENKTSEAYGEELGETPASTDFENNATQAYVGSEALGPDMAGIILSNITHVASIVAVGVLVAFGVFLYAKKKILPLA